MALNFIDKMASTTPAVAETRLARSARGLQATEKRWEAAAGAATGRRTSGTAATATIAGTRTGPVNGSYGAEVA
jgi:hypothetical protein